MSREESLQVLEVPSKCDLEDLEERDTVRAWLQVLAQAARESD